MSAKEDIKEVQDELNDLKQNTWFMDISGDYKQANKMLYRICIILLILLVASVIYNIYLLNDIGTETTTKESYEVEQSGDNGNNNFINGNKNEVNNGKAKD